MYFYFIEPNIYLEQMDWTDKRMIVLLNEYFWNKKKLGLSPMSGK